MKKVIKMLLLAYFLFLPQIVHAQGFLLGLIAGDVLSQDKNINNTTILYTNIELSKKIIDPLKIKMIPIAISTYEDYFKNLDELFQEAIISSKNKRRKTKNQKVVPKVNNLKILQILRVPNQMYIYLYFFYTEKSNLKEIVQ